MSDLFLIAHKVRGEPAFDVAARMRCPHCNGVGGCNVPDFETGIVTDYEGSSCHECDGLGYWWIIPTSGHRAYPIMNWPVSDLGSVSDYHSVSVLKEAGPLEAHPQFALLPDHYTTHAAPQVSLAEALGLTTRPRASVPIKRRF